MVLSHPFTLGDSMSEEAKNPLEILSDEELSNLRLQAQLLLQDNEDLAGICASMIAARRLFSVAMGHLIKHLDGKWNAELLREYIVSATKQQSEKEFTGRELHANISGGALPWLVGKIAEAAREDSLDPKEEDGESQNRSHENNGKA